jgi:hypothetical protein
LHRPPAHVSALSGQAYTCIRPVIRNRWRRSQPYVAVSCRLSTHRRSLVGHPVPPGGWAFLTVGLPGTVAGVWTPSGFPRSAHTRCDRGGRPLYPGTAVLSQPDFPVRLAPAALSAARPVPHWCNPSAGLVLTRHHQGFTCVHPSGLPLTCSPRMEQRPLGFPPDASNPTVTGDARQEQGQATSTGLELHPRHRRTSFDALTCNVRPRVAQEHPPRSPCTLASGRPGRSRGDLRHAGQGAHLVAQLGGEGAARQ